MKKIIILLATGFEEIEFVVPVDVLRRLGHQVTVAGVSAKTVAGSHNIIVEADVLLEEVANENFDAILLPGGMPGATNLKASQEVLQLVKKIAASGGIVAAVCAAPLVLNAAGLLSGRRWTAFPAPDLYSLYGGEPSGNAFEVDGNIITGQGPGVIYDFVQALAKELGDGEKVDELYRTMLVKR